MAAAQSTYCGLRCDRALKRRRLFRLVVFCLINLKKEGRKEKLARERRFIAAVSHNKELSKVSIPLNVTRSRFKL